MEIFAPIRFEFPAVRVLDQTRLPREERWIELDTVDAVCEAVLSLRVRGAPFLGLIGASGVAVAARVNPADAALAAAAERIGATRPTAVELHSGAAAALEVALHLPNASRLAALWKHAEGYLARRVAEDLALARFGAELIPAGAVLTHCNTGGLATGGIGSALGVVRMAWEQGRVSRCYTTETRPLLQGARLTMWELEKAGIPATLLPDTAAASLIASGRVQAVVTGADRIAVNGDSANKVGTYGLAAVAARHRVPFFIAAPRSTFDPDCPDGAAIPIEFRPPHEVGGFEGRRWAPDGIDTYNPAFDVTPGELVTAFITESGAIRPPFLTSNEA